MLCLSSSHTRRLSLLKSIDDETKESRALLHVVRFRRLFRRRRLLLRLLLVIIDRKKRREESLQYATTRSVAEKQGCGTGFSVGKYE